MTKQLTAGRELDALVAEQVMGECRHDWRKTGYTAWGYQCAKCGAKDGSPISGPSEVGEGKPYSTDIAFALEVAYKMLDSDHCPQFMDKIVEAANLWMDVAPQENVWEMFQWLKDPANICRAALAAVGEG